MKAVAIGKDGVEIKNLPQPKPANNQVLVKVKSCGINRSDLLETQGQSFGHIGGDTKIIGGEFAEEIVQLGEGVNDLKIGGNVMCRGGSGWAEYALANSKRSIKFDADELSWEQAATIQGNMQTMHDAIVTNGNFNYDLHAKRRLHYVGTTGITRSVEENLEVARIANHDLWEQVSNGKIRHVIFKSFPLNEAKDALYIMQ